MYDSTVFADCPRDGQLYLGYIDGRYAWPQSDIDAVRGLGAIFVPCAVFASTDGGVVGDVEDGCMTPAGALAWTKRRRAAGASPTLYVNRANAQAVRDAFTADGTPLPPLLLAAYDGVREVPDGYIGKQYANAPLTGGHYDTSAVADFWPGVDKESHVSTPTYVGQSVTNINLTVGQVGEYDCVYNYPDHGGDCHIVGKVVAYQPGVRLVVVYPPADPDADPTQVLDAQPCYFVVAAR